VETAGPLSDAAFYRLVACAAPPDGPCAKPFYRWAKSDITVAITQSAPAFLGGKAKRADAAVVRAVQRLNAVGMSVTLRQTSGSADITVHLLDTARGTTITNSTAPLLNGLTMANAITAFEVTAHDVTALDATALDVTALDVTGSVITGAAIGVSNTLPLRQYESVLLEEITQALGLITDIQNPYYETRSILSQNADNSLKTLGTQDRMALIRHYPPD